jgi:hypothetical protein
MASPSSTSELTSQETNAADPTTKVSRCPFEVMPLPLGSDPRRIQFLNVALLVLAESVPAVHHSQCRTVIWELILKVGGKGEVCGCPLFLFHIVSPLPFPCYPLLRPCDMLADMTVTGAGQRQTSANNVCATPPRSRVSRRGGRLCCDAESLLATGQLGPMEALCVANIIGVKPEACGCRG